MRICESRYRPYRQVAIDADVQLKCILNQILFAIIIARCVNVIKVLWLLQSLIGIQRYNDTYIQDAFQISRIAVDLNNERG